MTRIVSTLVWYVALSQRSTVSSYQPGSSLSRALTNYWRNSAIISLFVVAWARLNHTLPSVSRAAIRDSRGVTAWSYRLPSPPFFAQTFRTKLVSLSQVSSTLITLFPCSMSLSSMRAYYCLWTSTLFAFAWGSSFFVLRKLSLNSVFKTWRTIFWLTLQFISAFTASYSYLVVKRGRPSSSHNEAVVRIASFN